METRVQTHRIEGRIGSHGVVIMDGRQGHLLCRPSTLTSRINPEVIADIPTCPVCRRRMRKWTKKPTKVSLFP